MYLRAHLQTKPADANRLPPAPTSFCKCTCFSNSTIIPLDPTKSSSGSASIDNVLNLYERAFDSVAADPAEGEHDIIPRAQKYRALSCNDCNRKFCLNYELPTCKGAKEEDVFTTCFRKCGHAGPTVAWVECDRDIGGPNTRKEMKNENNTWTRLTSGLERDSRKDEAVVFLFIFATGGLLAWALAKPWIERYLEAATNGAQAARERRSYMPVSENDS
ncbi:uncharacterized protein N7484_001756 [Penicillium longicatenatum]|uniref:uncharacterized protein n=1 Tax=Penicillium longicatenatum TaxID=1561947 RepID=UPI0025483C2D|nr:uncharacterized protein N7484_001756 [Penicillium longicatenatum]KAJ5658107.1 hypothetical protein N7484_001756 [Penicillium longicatenatum]